MVDTAGDGITKIPQETDAYSLTFSGQLKMMAGAFWATPVRNRFLMLSGGLLILIFSTAYGQLLLNEWNAPFFDSIERRNLSAFFYQLKIFALIAGSLLLLNVFQAWLNQLTAMYMREGLSRDLVDQWLKSKRALKLASFGTIGINPDQRLHEDSRNFAEITTALAIGLVNSTILLASFIGVLWAISANFSFDILGRQVAIPGYMVWAAILYAGTASVLSNVVGRKLPALNVERYSREAELRFTLMHTNENLTAITLAHGEENERQRIQASISRVLVLIRSLAIGYTNLTWVSSGFGWLSTIAPIVIAAPAYFSGGLTFGGLMMAVGAFNQVNAALRWYVDNFRQIADWKAALTRVSTFRNALCMMDEAVPGVEAPRYSKSGDESIRLSKLELYTASHSVSGQGVHLAEDELIIRQGERLMINGDAGANRRLLFHALAGIWPMGHGEVSVPNDGTMLFVPQKGYFPDAPLREILAYPRQSSDFSEVDMIAALGGAGLSEFASRLEDRERWDRTLDDDKQARLRIANALLIAPRWLIIDDVLEGLDSETQDDLAEVLDGMKDTAIVYIGNSEAFEHKLAPKRIHLEAL